MKNKKVIILIVVIVALILLFPIPMRLKDGGSIRLQALLYNVTFYNKLNHATDDGYTKEIGIKVLGLEVFNNTIVEEHTLTEERIKLSDLKIKVEGVDTTKLLKYDGNLYGQSFALIDYAGDLNKSIGKINFLVEEKYLPQLDGETNCKEFFDATVLEADDKNMILNVNNVAVLFNVIEKDNIKKTNGELLFEKCGEDEGNNTQSYNSFVGTVLEETTTYMIVEPNEDEEVGDTGDGRADHERPLDHFEHCNASGKLDLRKRVSGKRTEYKTSERCRNRYDDRVEEVTGDRYPSTVDVREKVDEVLRRRLNDVQKRRGYVSFTKGLNRLNEKVPHGKEHECSEKDEHKGNSDVAAL